MSVSFNVAAINQNGLQAKCIREDEGENNGEWLELCYARATFLWVYSKKFVGPSAYTPIYCERFMVMT